MAGNRTASRIVHVIGNVGHIDEIAVLHGIGVDARPSEKPYRPFAGRKRGRDVSEALDAGRARGCVMTTLRLPGSGLPPIDSQVMRPMITVAPMVSRFSLFRSPR